MERYGSPEFDPFSSVPMYMQSPEALGPMGVVNGAGESMARAIMILVTGGTAVPDESGLRIPGRLNRHELSSSPTFSTAETNFDGMSDGGLDALMPVAPVIPLGSVSLRGALSDRQTEIATAYTQAA